MCYPLGELPAVIGWFRPVVLLPVSALTGLSEEQLRSIIAHELAHIQRFDAFVNLFQIAVETLFFYHPAVSPVWAIWGNLICQVLSHLLTGAMWGRWQAALSTDPLGAQGPVLAKILRTHWIRTGLINAYAFILFTWVVFLLR